ncbi:MAG TPA: hypothetical protein D7H86_06445, partial [Candidatus Poseidoniales archaeon]
MEDYDFLTSSMSEVLSLDSKKNSLESLIKEKKAHLNVQKTELEELEKTSKKDIKKLSNYDPIKSQERIDSFQDEVNKLRQQNSELQIQISEIPEPKNTTWGIDSITIMHPSDKEGLLAVIFSLAFIITLLEMLGFGKDDNVFCGVLFFGFLPLWCFFLYFFE